MPLNGNGGSKFVTVLNVGPGVGTYIVTPAHVAIHERDNAVSFALWRSEPNRILRVLKQRPSPSGANFAAHFAGAVSEGLKVPEPLWLPSLGGLAARVPA